MHHKHEISRIEYDEDPERCQGIVAGKRQCILKVVSGSRFCPIHGGNKHAEATKKRSMFKYRLTKYQARIDAHQESNTIKSLRDEVAIVRLLLQKLLDTCNSDLLASFTLISRMVGQIESLALSCAKVENALTGVLDQSNALLIATNILTAVKQITPDSFDDVQDDIVLLMDRTHHQTSAPTQSNYLFIPTVESEIKLFITDDKIINLRAEIAVLRIIVEEKLNTCRGPQDFIFAANPILDAISKIERLVQSCQKLEDSMGLLLDKDAAMNFANELITIVGNYVTDPDQLAKISEVINANCQ